MASNGCSALSPALQVLVRVFTKEESIEESGVVSLALKDEHRATPRVCAPIHSPHINFFFLSNSPHIKLEPMILFSFKRKS